MEVATCNLVEKRNPTMYRVATTVTFVILVIPLGIVWTASNPPHHSTSDEVHAAKHAVRIINGDIAQDGEFPSQVSILKHGIPRFGGSILAYKWILTTARVADGKPDDYVVLAGTSDLNHGGTYHGVKQVLPYLLYNATGDRANDLALLRLMEPIALGNFAQIIPLYEGKLTEGMSGLAVGWGRYVQGNIGVSFHLRKAKLRISNRDKCNFAYSEVGITIKPTQVCAEDPLGSAGPCEGDAGGALIVDGKVAGITSWSLGCALQRYPNVLTNVSKYVQWIRKIIEFHS